MRKRIWVLGFLFLFLISTNVFAGGVGNCTKPMRTTTENIGVGVGFEYNNVLERMNKLANNEPGTDSMRIKEAQQFYGKLTAGLFDNFNLYAKVGACNYRLKFEDTSDNSTVDVKFENGIYGGVGINALFPLTAEGTLPFDIGYDVQANTALNDVDRVTRGGQRSTDQDGTFYSIDGQNSIYLTYTYEVEEVQTLIIPYIGAYHSWVIVGSLSDLEYTTANAGAVAEKDFRPAFDFLSFGMMLGVDLDIAKYINLNVAGRFIGETAVTTGATIKF